MARSGSIIRAGSVGSCAPGRFLGVVGDNADDLDASGLSSELLWIRNAFMFVRDARAGESLAGICEGRGVELG